VVLQERSYLSPQSSGSRIPVMKIRRGPLLRSPVILPWLNFLARCSGTHRLLTQGNRD
jgi:hypothetical protein